MEQQEEGWGAAEHSQPRLQGYRKGCEGSQSSSETRSFLKLEKKEVRDSEYLAENQSLLERGSLGKEWGQ